MEQPGAILGSMADNAFGVTPETPPPGASPEAGQQGSSEDERRSHKPEDAGSNPVPATNQEPPAQPEPPAPATDDDDPEAKAFEAAEGEDGIRLGNRVYKDWNAADHVFRQFAGRAKAEARRRKELESQLEDERRARSDAEAHRPSHPQGDTSGAPPDSGPAPQASKRLKDLVTPEEFNRVVAEEGIDAAFVKLAEMVDARVDQGVEERFAPVAPLVNRQQGAEMAADLFGQASDFKNEDGSYVYPELDPDQPSSDAVVAIWQRRVNDDERFRDIAFDPLAVELSVLEFRAAANSQPASRDAARPAARPAAAAIQDMGRQGSASPASPGPTRRMIVNPEETARRIIADRTHSVFGVEMEQPIRR